MNDPLALIGLASAGLVAFALMGAAALRGWTGWLELKRLELSTAPGAGETRLPSPTAARIELAALKERVRRLEAIASGVDL